MEISRDAASTEGQKRPMRLNAKAAGDHDRNTGRERTVYGPMLLIERLRKNKLSIYTRDQVLTIYMS